MNVRDYSFDERLEFSKGRKLETDQATIKEMVAGATAVRQSTRNEERLGIDYVATLRGGAEVFIDAKARQAGCSRYWRHQQPELSLEKWSVTPESSGGAGKVGWTLSEVKSTDLILFTFAPDDCLDCYLLPFQHLRLAFRRNVSEWESLFGLKTQSTDGRYQSACICVPVDLVFDAMIDVSRYEPSRGEHRELFQ